ncbi:MAG: signal peptidase II [Eubacteriales bacterium]|jgi:signal peptidase II|nr:signal peptidase II [Bacillota bacterium]MBV1727402.1 signal peptidase II [Desulforudis sp.]MDQ7792736.1 signal peptidase II [Clostridia bacterium]MDZ4043707.1 signal peptidase II [Eubacteriales bacterium]MBU4532876.1 signal peptidase II [Bacillota bacterium]
MLLRFWALVIAVLAADQITKQIVVQQLTPGTPYPVVEGVLNLTYILNPGGAFGFLASLELLLLAVTLLVVAVIVTLHLAIIRSGYGLPVALLLGGAIGNLVDRLRLGAVIDFIDFGFWPVFNVADIAIVVGIALLVYRVIRSKPDDTGEARG